MPEKFALPTEIALVLDLTTIDLSALDEITFNRAASVTCNRGVNELEPSVIGEFS